MTKEIKTYTPEDFEREFSLDDSAPLPSKAAVSALVRATGSNGDDPIIFRMSSGELARSAELRRDGCDMIKAAYLFLELLECPWMARDFVIALMGVSRGDSASILTIPDALICRHTGWDKRTSQRKRKIFIKWSQDAKLSLIEIIEQDYDTAAGKYLPTQYKVSVTDYVARFVMLARERECWDVATNNYSVERAIEAGLSDVADEVAKDIPVSQITRRRFKRTGKGGDKTTLSSRRRFIEDKLKGNVFDWTQAILDMGYMLEIEVATLQELLQESLNAGAEAWERRKASIRSARNPQ